MSIIIDTDVLSLVAPERPEPPASLRQWIEQRSGALYLSAVTVAELERGVRKLERTGRVRKARAIEHWFANVLQLYAERVLPFDMEAALIAGRLDDAAVAKGFNLLFADIVIAATAVRHDMAVATRNTRHFAPLGVRLAELPI